MADTIIVGYNDLTAVEALFRARGDAIAAVIVEPVAGNMGVVPPLPGFLEGLRALTAQYGSILIFDEVMTGWRAHPQGAQVLYQIAPDLTCLGKVMGGGLPAAGYGGRADLMRQIAPSGSVYQAGTLAGNPVAMAAGLATLEALDDPTRWESAERWCAAATDHLRRSAQQVGVPLVVHRVGTMFTAFFTSVPVTDYASAKCADRSAYTTFFHAMLGQGVYLAPSAFEAGFTSTVHGSGELEHWGRAVEVAIRQVHESHGPWATSR